MRIVLIIFSAVLLTTLVEAQRKPNITKPVVNLQNRPRPPVWNRPPEERRKLSIFPKTNMKFVVTPKTVKNDDTAKGLPTKRPLMRKFIIQDKNEEGTWSFAPREPLMKTNRFTVTLAPPKPNRQTFDEMKSEESRKVNTVISKPKLEQESSKRHNINKGNLIEMTQSKKKDTPVSNNLTISEQKLEADVILYTMVNDTRNTDIIQLKDNSTLIFDKVPENYTLDIQRIGSAENSNEMNQKQYEPFISNQTVNVSQMKQSTESIEGRSFDVKEIKNPIDQNESNKLTVDNEQSNSSQTLHFNDLEILLEKIVNNTESSNYNSKSGLNGNILSNTPKIGTNTMKKDIPKFDVTKPNQFYDIISIDNKDDNNTNLEELPVVSTLQENVNGKIHTASETNSLIDKENISENVADSLVVGNLENLLNFMEKEAESIQNRAIINGESEIISHNGQEIKILSNDLVTEKLNTNTSYTDSKITNNFTQGMEMQTELPKELLSKNSQELALEIYESNLPLNSEEASTELLDEQNDEMFPEFMNSDFNLTLSESLNINNSDSIAADFSNESISDTSINYAEERSNEPLIDTSNNFTGEEIFNELSSNMAGEELSNESYTDKSNNLTEEISNEYSSNMAGEELSNESYPDKSNKLTEEMSNESVIEASDSFTGEELSIESSSNLAGEALSNESYPDKSNNLPEEISNESVIEASNSFTSEEISNDSSSNMAGEELSNESYPDKSNNLTEEISNESIIESNNFTGEEISNESSSNTAGEEISNESYPDIYNLTVDETNESIIEIPMSLIVEQITNESSSDTASEEIPNEYTDKSSNLTEKNQTFDNTEDISEELLADSSEILIDKRISDVSVESSRDLEIAEEALTNRFKRSNNIIEEENIPTTVSGFRYTGHEVKLNHDLSFKNINA